MVKQPSLLVLGAGAGHDVDMPTGEGIKPTISSMLDFRFRHFGEQTRGDHLIVSALRKLVQESSEFQINDAVDAAHLIRDALPLAISIDNLIDNHRRNREVELLGKLSIVRSILAAEGKSKLRTLGDPEQASSIIKQLSRTWFAKLFRLLSENADLPCLADRFAQLAIVNFNYDRCFETFLIHAIEVYYGVARREAADLVSRIQIYHPYGTVGNLTWQEGDASIDFGVEPTPNELLLLARGIRTFNEGVDPNRSSIDHIHRAIMNAEKLIFLGFAYHRQNMELLTPSEKIPDHYTPKQVFGTALGISKSDTSHVKASLNKVLSERVSFAQLRNDLTCEQLFDEYWRALSLAG